jgi:hypothetical protein
LRLGSLADYVEFRNPLYQGNPIKMIFTTKDTKNTKEEKEVKTFAFSSVPSVVNPLLVQMRLPSPLHPGLPKFCR